MQAYDSLTTGDLGQMFNVSADTVRRWWPDWVRLKSFPKPLPLVGGARAILRWDAAAVETWRGMSAGSEGADIDTTDWAMVARARRVALDRGENLDGPG
jgi:hypothetical protein